MPTLQDYLLYNVRPVTILTGSYVAGTVVENVHLKNQLIVLARFVIGNLTDGRIKVEFSNDNSNFYQESFSSIAAGVDTVSLGEHKFTASGSYRIAVPIKDRYIKISAIGTGDATGSSMFIDAIIGVS